MTPTICQETIRRCLRTGIAAAASVALSGVSLADQATNFTQISVATQLTEVQRATFDGRDYLTLHIGGHDVGPSNCRGNILRMDTNSTSIDGRQAKIESLALSAMLSSRLVMIVIPLDASQCVDGKPTFTDLYFLSEPP